MKSRIVRLLSIAVVVFITTTAAHGQSGSGKCQLNTLNGAYGFTSTGDITGPPALRFAAVGVQEFDGQGNFKVVNTISVGGGIKRALASTGTYTVNPDCTGSFFGGAMEFVIVDNGKQVYAIAAVNGQVLTAVYTRL